MYEDIWLIFQSLSVSVDLRPEFAPVFQSEFMWKQREKKDSWEITDQCKVLHIVS